MGGGVQTHSVLTLPDYLVDKNIKLEIRCEATENPEELFDIIEVTREGRFGQEYQEQLLNFLCLRLR